jgi:hypothetical protein
MKMIKSIAAFIILAFATNVYGTPVIYVNQVGFNIHDAKIAVVSSDVALAAKCRFMLINTKNLKAAFTGYLTSSGPINEWMPGKLLYRAVFSTFTTPGSYRLKVSIKGKTYNSVPFLIGDNALAKLTIPAILHYYRKQRANTPQELAADSHITLFGSAKTVDLRGGWCDASGDVSKYFSHLAYANFMSPQQIPLVTWSLINTTESIPRLLVQYGVKDSVSDEAIYGADYLMRSLSKEDYFYMTVFSYFNKDPNARRVVGLHANSVTTTEYQSAFREGGGMAIAALARISRWKKNGAFKSAQYLDAAKRAFGHLMVNNTKYDDDGKENIIDDYCALMAATELWIATDSSFYRDQARSRAHNLTARMSRRGYFIADDKDRPFWHASDAGLPIIALCRYLKKESNLVYRDSALKTIKKALNYNLHITNSVNNPFGYARQTFKYNGDIKEGFFIPHENETGWWWQGENARLASLATAAIVGGRLVYPNGSNSKAMDSLKVFASQQLGWILGCNPYAMCFMYRFGKNNVPYMHSNFGHGSERGGISNGITGKDGNPDGSGIDFKTSADGNEWRWTEQWIPHAAWFLQAVTALSQ